MHLRHLRTYHAEITDGDSAGGAPSTVKVDLFDGIALDLPKDQAEKIIAARQADKEARRKLAEEHGALRAEKEAATKAAKESQDRAEMEKLQKAGEFQKAQELMERRHAEKLAGITGKITKAAIAEKMSKHSDITDTPKTRELMAKQLMSSCKYDEDTDTLMVMDAAGRPAIGSDGKPLSVDALVKQFLDDHPDFRKASKTPGSGAAGTGPKPGAKTMTQAQVADLGTTDPKALARFFAEGGQMVG
jgi:hypothetical protein